MLEPYEQFILFGEFCWGGGGAAWGQHGGSTGQHPSVIFNVSNYICHKGTAVHDMGVYCPIPPIVRPQLYLQSRGSRMLAASMAWG